MAMVHVSAAAVAFFQNAYSAAFRGSDLECKDPSLAQQNFKDEVDVNVLMERFKVTGQMPQGLRVPSYGDFSGVSDFRSAAESVRAAQDAFLALPAKLRNRFQNDPQAFLEFCSNPDNRDEMVSLGLIDAPAAPAASSEPAGGTPPAGPAS